MRSALPIFKKIYRLHLCLFVAWVVCPCLRSSAEEVVIVDSRGFEHGMAEVEGSGLVEFELKDPYGRPADGVEVTLRNTSTNETYTQNATAGMVTFDGVPPGIWEVTSAVDWVTFTEVRVTGGAALLSAGGIGVGSALLGVGALGGGVYAISEATKSSGSSDTATDNPPTTEDPPIVPTPTPDPDGNGGDDSSSRPGNDSAGGKRPLSPSR